MAKKLPDTVPAGPLFAWFKTDKKNRGKLRQAGYSDGRITNWRVRGIPRGEVGAVAEIMATTYEQYLAAAGVDSQASGRPIPIEDALALKRLQAALPDWRRYVLGLAMVESHDAQALLLRTMQQAVPDSRVEKFVGVAPHAASRRAAEKERK